MKRLIIANWKMNPQTLDEARRIASQIEHGFLGIDRSKVEAAICSPFVFLPMIKHAVHFIRLGAQDLAAFDGGPYTGEVSANQLLEFGTNLVIVGHSERRALGEGDSLVNGKMRIALEHKLEPILCVGFGTTKNMKDADVKKIIGAQLKKGLRHVNLKKARLAITYEPVWAISRGLGTGKAVAPSHAAAIIKFIKTRVPKARVLYGGSIDSKNSAGFASEGVIDGGLVGGASLHREEFLSIIKDFQNI